MARASHQSAKTPRTAPPVLKRTEQALLRRRAIVNAALDEFLDKGFAATRVEDVARRAGVAKGTIYLNFKDKEDLFAAIVEQEIRPNIDTAAIGPRRGETLAGYADRVMVPLLSLVIQSRRASIIRLLIGEAGRFPKLAEVYFRLIVEPGLTAIRGMLRDAAKRDELSDDMLLKFPHLMIAPAIFSVVWTGLFQNFSSLDVEAMLRAYYRHLLTPPEPKRPLTQRGRRSSK